MSINKSQLRSLQKVGLYLSKLMFSYGQLYVITSKVTSRRGLRNLIHEEDSK